MLRMMLSKIRVCGTGQDCPCEQEPHVIRQDKKFPEDSNVGVESLWVRVDVLFQLRKAQGLPDVAVRKVGLSQDDIILDVPSKSVAWSR